MSSERIAVVTGGAGGIGRAIVRRLIAQGIRPIIVDSNRKALASINQYDCFPCNVADSKQTEKTIGKIHKKYGRIDLLICCAGMIQPGPLCEVSEESIRQTLDVNFFGTLNCIRASASILETFKGHIIIVSSLAGIVPAPLHGAYCASKFALRGMALTLALELKGKGILVTNIMPDSIYTPMLVRTAIENGSPLAFLKDPNHPDDVAKAVIKAMNTRTLEIAVPKMSGLQARLAALFPSVIPIIWPRMQAKGERRLRRIRAGADSFFGDIESSQSLL